MNFDYGKYVEILLHTLCPILPPVRRFLREIRSPTPSKETPVTGHVQVGDCSESSSPEKDFVSCLWEGQCMAVRHLMQGRHDI